MFDVNRPIFPLVVVLALTLARTAQAQPPAGLFEDLPGLLKSGETVLVTDDGGHRTRGSISQLSSELLELHLKSQGTVVGVRRFQKEQVAKITRADSTWDGTLIAAGVGAGVGMYLARNGEGPLVLAPPVFGAVGALIGYLADRVQGNRTVYQAAPGARPAGAEAGGRSDRPDRSSGRKIR